MTSMFKMSSSEKQKAKKRKNRRTTAKSVVNSSTTSSSNPFSITTSEQDLAVIQRLMDADDVSGLPDPPPFSRGPNPYLGGERCLLCRCERPDPPQAKQDNKLPGKDFQDSSKNSGGVGSLSQLPLWVCPDCRKTVEEEEKKAAAYDPSLLEQELRLDPPSLPFLSDASSDFTTSTNSVCTCEACTERRQIEAEHEKETQELQQCWMELRHVVRCIYREAGTGLASPDSPDGEPSPQRDSEKIQELVHRLCARDAHQLYQRLESQCREYIVEMQVRLRKQLTTGHKTPVQAKQFVSMLLEEYSNLCAAAKMLASFLTELESEHLKRFNLTWELHNKHLFQSIIYSDPFIQTSLPMLIAQLRSGASTKESYSEDTYPNLLHRYHKFDNEMPIISVVWRDCQQLIEAYNDEQATLRAKQKMLKEDWEFFKAQRRLLEQQVMKKPPTPSASHNFETQFTETMRHILQTSKPAQEECQCPSCNKKRYESHWLLPQTTPCSATPTCPCEECTLTKMIKQGIVPTSDDSGSNNSSDPATSQTEHSAFTSACNMASFPTSCINSTSSTTGSKRSYAETSPYLIDVSPPSMSSTNSSSGSSSPINVDPKRLVLPFDVCPESFELADDEIPEEIEDDDESLSDSDERGDADDNEGDDEGGDDEEDEEEEEEEGSYTANTEYQSAEEGLELASMMDEQDNNVTTSGEGVAEFTSEDAVTAGAPVLGLPTVTADALKSDCGCTHCTRARLDQKPAQEVLNPCQCHACLVQSGKNVPTCLPHVPTAPRAAAFHLYPHIHGSNCLQSATVLHGHNPHMGNVLQSQVYEYEVHSPNSSLLQPKSLLNPTKKHHASFNLDLDSHDALHEHIYHAYADGEWDNAYDNSKLLLGSNKFGGFGSDLFSAPPPPLMNGSPFINVGDQFSTEAALSLASAMKSSLYQHNTMAMSSPLTSMATSTTFANTNVATTSDDHIHTEACFKNMKSSSHSLLSTSQPLATAASRAMTSGCGAVPSSVASMAASVASGNPVILATSSATTTPPTSSISGLPIARSEHCLKHNPFLHTHHASFTSSHTTTTISPSPPVSSHQFPGKLTPDVIRSAALSVKEEAARNSNKGQANPAPLNLPHTCSHQHNPASGNSSSPQLPANANQPFIPPNLPNLPALNSLNNITVSGVCNDPDCDGNHDADYDSVDDSCSEQSSSTSTSNQKDGKYCDCCYCEFFGHSNPPQAPTSRNYAEIRDRLRLRLKKKVKVEQKPEVEPVRQPPPPPPPKVEVVDDRGVEELLRFINGEEKENKSASAKAAKRARQKQKKAEERAKREAEMKAALEQERLHQEHRNALAKAMEEADKQRQALLQKHAQMKEEAQKKKRSKLKEKESKLTEKPHGCQGKEKPPSRGTPPPPQTSLAPKTHVATRVSVAPSACTGNTSNAGKCTARSNNKSLSKRGEADGCQAPTKSTLSTVNRKEAPQPHAVSRSTIQPQRTPVMCTKAKTVEEKLEKPKRSKVSSLAPHDTNCTGLKPEHHNTHQSQPGKFPSSVPVKNQTNPHQRTGFNINNSKVNDLSSVNHQRDANRNNHSKTCENNSLNQQRSSHQPTPTPVQQQHSKLHSLNNNNHPKKGESLVNGIQTPPPVRAATMNQARKNNNQPTPPPTKQPPMNETPPTHNPKPQLNLSHPARNGQGDGQPMVNGNTSPPADPGKKAEAKILKVSAQQTQAIAAPLKRVEAKLPVKPAEQQPPPVVSGKQKKNKRKNKSEDLEEIFMPKDLDPEGEIDDLDREIEEFKRFCLDSTPMPKQEKLQVNMNLKDIFNKKKSGMSCA